MRFHDRDTLARKAVQVLLRHGKPMSPRDISHALDALKIGSKADDRVSTVKRALQTAVEDPLEFTPLVRESDGTYSLARQNDWSNRYTAHAWLEALSDYNETTITQKAFDIYQSGQHARFKRDVRESMHELLCWALSEGALTGDLRVSRLLNWGWQQGRLEGLFHHYDNLDLESLLPHLRRALHDQERDSLTGVPVYVWAGTWPDKGDFMLGSESPKTAAISAFMAQDDAIFRETVRETLERLGATNLVEVLNDSTVMFRGTQEDWDIAVGAYQSFAPLEQDEVRQLRGALRAGERGIIFNLGAISDQAKYEGEREGVALVALFNGTELIHTVTTSLRSPVMPVVGDL